MAVKEIEIENGTNNTQNVGWNFWNSARDRATVDCGLFGKEVIVQIADQILNQSLNKEIG